MTSLFLFILKLVFFVSAAQAGLDKYSYLDKINDWVIERRVDSSTNMISCRASIPGYWTWFGDRIRLDKNNDLLVPKAVKKSQRPGALELKKVKLALKACRKDLLYIYEK